MSKLKPIIWTLHDPWALGGHCVHHFDCEKWKAHCYDCEYLDVPFAINNDTSALEFELKKEAIQKSNIVAIVASKWLENQIIQSPIWKGKQIYRIPFGIDQNKFKPKDIKEAKKELGIDEDSIVLMFRCDNNIFKGLNIIKESLKKIKSKNKITLITVSEKDLLKEFKDTFNILEYGWIKDETIIVKLYQACDIFLMPSKQETFGLMAIEAMSCGKMVLALEGEGTSLPEVINSPECGLACKEEEYSEKLQYFIDNLNEVKERGKKSLEFARQNYSKDIYLTRILEVYKKTIENHKLDETSKLILEQLQKYCITNIINDTNNGNIINNTYFGIFLYSYYKYFIINILGLKITFKKKESNKTKIFGIYTINNNKYIILNILGLKITFKK